MPHGASSNLQAVAGRSFPWSTFEVTKDVSIAGVDQPLESRVIVGLQPKRGPSGPSRTRNMLGISHVNEREPTLRSKRPRQMLSRNHESCLAGG